MSFLTCNWSILGFTCMKVFPQYQVFSLDSTSQATQVETCSYVVWGKERNLYQWSTNRGPAAALVKFQNPIAVKNLEIFTVVIITWQNIYQAVNRIYSFSFSLQDMKVRCLYGQALEWGNLWTFISRLITALLISWSNSAYNHNNSSYSNWITKSLYY